RRLPPHARGAPRQGRPLRRGRRRPGRGDLLQLLRPVREPAPDGQLGAPGGLLGVSRCSPRRFPRPAGGLDSPRRDGQDWRAVVGGVARLARAFAAVLLALAAPQAAAQQGVVLRLNPAAVEAWGVVRQGIARYAVAVRLTDECAAELGEFTAQHVGQRLELRLTRSLVLVANISARVDSGRIQFPSVATTARALAQL